ncbi:hypothetical protein T4D_5457 [Trichinella pseudospiralis]|uniref:Neurotransmitter-gated ion-channel ligand-binding domain-containing protein n=1 Tax=Trichinella pseudospiralis TaxID=6337 RepID=A0A0V1FRV9_TRIPS|nr:hypothetical protein T4D_5457 [Trichinella pseudospiralis]
MVSLKVKPPLVGNHWKPIVVEQFGTTNTDRRSAKVPSSRRLLSSLCFFLSACASNCAAIRDKEKQPFPEQTLEDRVGGLNTLNELLVDYNYHIRPSAEKNLPLQINVSIHVLNVEWKADKLTLLYSLCQSWHDDRLIFKGYKEIRFPYMKIIWMPDLYSPMEISKNILNSGYVSVTPNGEVRLRQRILTEQPCLLTVQKVVEDDGKLNCTWTAKSYQHNADELQLYLENVVTLNDDLQGRAIAYSSDGFHDTVNTSTGQHYRIEVTYEIDTGITKAVLENALKQLTYK